MAGTDVTTAIRSTKTKFAFERIECGMNGIEIMPANGKRKDKNKNEDSVMICNVQLVYSSFSLFSFIYLIDA